MKHTPLKRKTPLRQVSAKRKFAAMTPAARRAAKLAPGKPLKAVAIRAASRRLRQGRSTAKPSAAEQTRFQHIRVVGCIACMLGDQRGFGRTEVHHLLVGGKHGQKRRGHAFTIGLCGWHHQGTRPQGMHEREGRKAYGPSFKLHARAFRETYGQDDELLDYQNTLIARRTAAQDRTTKNTGITHERT